MLQKRPLGYSGQNVVNNPLINNFDSASWCLIPGVPFIFFAPAPQTSWVRHWSINIKINIVLLSFQNIFTASGARGLSCSVFFSINWHTKRRKEKKKKVFLAILKINLSHKNTIHRLSLIWESTTFYLLFVLVSLSNSSIDFIVLTEECWFFFFPSQDYSHCVAWLQHTVLDYGFHWKKRFIQNVEETGFSWMQLLCVCYLFAHRKQRWNSLT